MVNDLLKHIGIFALTISAQCLAASAWTSECKDKVCRVSVEATGTAQNKRFLTFTVLFDRDGSNPAIVMTTPLGTVLDAGARFVVGSEELKLIYKVCFPDGCQAIAQLNAEQLTMLKGQAAGSARFFAHGKDQPLAADVALTGLDEAMNEAMKK